MSEKRIKSRIVLKHDTPENWAKATNFIPMVGELIVYEADDEYTYQRTKIGNGADAVSALPFTHTAITVEEIDSIIGGEGV